MFYLVQPTTHWFVGVVSLDWQPDSQTEIHVQHCTTHHPLICGDCVTRLTVWHSNRSPCSILCTPPPIVWWGVVSRLTVLHLKRGPCSILYNPSLIVNGVVTLDWPNINWRDDQTKNVVNNVDMSCLRAPWQNGPYKNNTRNDTKTLTTSLRNRHLDKL